VVIISAVNVSEGRDTQLLNQFSAVLGDVLLDRHSDPHHHRSVFTLAGSPDAVVDGARRLATKVVGLLSLSDHSGVHPRIGVLDVVPFAPYLPGQPPPSDLRGVLPMRDEFARWLAEELDLPAFLYGPLPEGERTLPEVRRRAFTDLAPDFGPSLPHPRAGAVAVGARPVLVAFNVWVDTMEVARQVAPKVRGPQVRALALAVGERAQVSTNLIDPAHLGPADLYDTVAELVTAHGGRVQGAELVGLIPESVLSAIPEKRWAELGLGATSTLERKLPRVG
jgi:glutamate formiminotransferase / 5-formyltetrahydrofolate cyclo-ligase